LLRETKVEAIGALIVATNGRCQGTFGKQITKLRRPYIAHPRSVKEIGLDVQSRGPRVRLSRARVDVFVLQVIRRQFLIMVRPRGFWLLGWTIVRYQLVGSFSLSFRNVVKRLLLNDPFPYKEYQNKGDHNQQGDKLSF
jgi:hypothetical protein